MHFIQRTARLEVGVFREAAHLLNSPFAFPDGGAGVADTLGGQVGGPAFEQGDDGLGDLVRVRRAAGQKKVHLDLFVQGVGAVQQRGQRRIAGIGVGVRGFAAAVVALE